MQERWSNHVILRSSIIYGPHAPQPVNRSLFLQARMAASWLPSHAWAERRAIFTCEQQQQQQQ